jgi:hypothetical protein
MSVNTLAVLTDQGDVYMAGLDRHFSLKKVKLPVVERGKVVNVGVAEDNVIVHMDSGVLYTLNPLLFDAGNKYHSKEKLYKIQHKGLINLNGLKITGKYDTIVGSFQE